MPITETVVKEFAHLYKFGQAVQPSKKAIDNIKDLIYNLYYDYCDKGITFEFVDHEPYHDADEMFYRFEMRNHLKVSTLHNESVFEPETNLLFRAVHDMHHIENKAGFDLAGELFCANHIRNVYFNRQSEESKILFSEIALQAAFALYFGEFPLEQKVVFL